MGEYLERNQAFARALDPQGHEDNQEATAAEELRSSDEDATIKAREMMIERADRIANGQQPPDTTKAFLPHECSHCKAAPPNFTGRVERKTGGPLDSDLVALPAVFSNLCQICYDKSNIELQLENIMSYPGEEQARQELAARTFGSSNYTRESLPGRQTQHLKAVAIMQNIQNKDYAGDASFSFLSTGRRDAENAVRNSATNTIAPNAVDSPPTRRSTLDTRTVSMQDESIEEQAINESSTQQTGESTSSGRHEVSEQEKVEARNKRFCEDRTLSPASVAQRTAAARELPKRQRAGNVAILTHALQGIGRSQHSQSPRGKHSL